MLVKIGSQLDPETYRVMIPDMDIETSSTPSQMASMRELNETRCYFTGCQEIHLHNSTGRALKVGSGHGGIQQVDADCTAAISLNNLEPTSQSQLSFSIERYKIVRGVAVSPYQTIMIPLIRHRKNSRVKRGKKQSSASGFRYVTYVYQNSFFSI